MSYYVKKLFSFLSWLLHFPVLKSVTALKIATLHHQIMASHSTFQLTSAVRMNLMKNKLLENDLESHFWWCIYTTFQRHNLLHVRIKMSCFKCINCICCETKRIPSIEFIRNIICVIHCIMITHWWHNFNRICYHIE